MPTESATWRRCQAKRGPNGIIFFLIKNGNVRNGFPKQEYWYLESQPPWWDGFEQDSVCEISLDTKILPKTWKHLKPDNTFQQDPKQVNPKSQISHARVGLVSNNRVVLRLSQWTTWAQTSTANIWFSSEILLKRCDVSHGSHGQKSWK